MLAVRARCSTRLLSTTARLRRPDDVPKPPPKPVDDSTSALEYKRTHRHKPPPLPVMDVPRRSAEEAVTNILYNTPPPSLQPFKKHDLLSSLIQSTEKLMTIFSSLFPGTSLTASSRMNLACSHACRASSLDAGSTLIHSSSAVPKYAISAECVSFSADKTASSSRLADNSKTSYVVICACLLPLLSSSSDHRFPYGPSWTTPTPARSPANSFSLKYLSLAPSTSKNNSKAASPNIPIQPSSTARPLLPATLNTAPILIIITITTPQPPDLPFSRPHRHSATGTSIFTRYQCSQPSLEPKLWMSATTVSSSSLRRRRLV